MSYKTGFYEGRLGIGLGSTMGMGDGNPRYPLDINGDIRLTGSIINGDGQVLSLTPPEFDPAGLDSNNRLMYNNVDNSSASSTVTTIAIGDQALSSLTSGTRNIALGYLALRDTTTGANNIGIGGWAGLANTGSYNIFMGHQVGYGTGAGSSNVGLGQHAILNLTSGNDNVAIGHDSAYYLTTGSNNVCLGAYAGGNMTTSGENVFIGSYAGRKNTTGGYHNVGLGYGTCGGTGSAAVNVQNNVCIGQSAGGSLESGYSNVFVGQYAGLQATTGAHNIAIGKEAGRYKTNKSGYIAIGQEALYSTSGGAQSIAIGYQALKSDVGWNHYDNVAIGYQSMRVVTSGVGNTCLGYVAGQNISSGWYNVLLGKKAGENITTGYRNICIGMTAGNTLTTTHDSVYIGTETGQYCDQQNIAIGYQSMRYQCSNYNIAIGYQAMVGTNHTGRAQNVCIGYQTLNPATSASWNVAVGHQAAMRVTSGGYNTIIGYKAGEHTGKASYNCLFGAYAGSYLTGNVSGGGSNVCIGAYSANANTSHVNAMSNCICIGTYAGPKTTDTSITTRLCIGAPGAQNGDSYRGSNSFIYGEYPSSITSRFLRFNARCLTICGSTYTTEPDLTGGYGNLHVVGKTNNICTVYLQHGHDTSISANQTLGRIQFASPWVNHSENSILQFAQIECSKDQGSGYFGGSLKLKTLHSNGNVHTSIHIDQFQRVGIGRSNNLYSSQINDIQGSCHIGAVAYTISKTAFQTLSWENMKVKVQETGHDGGHAGYWILPTRDMVLKLDGTGLMVAGQDIWVAGVTKLGGNADHKCWIQIGNTNHSYGTVHNPYPSWGDDNTTSYSFKQRIVLASKPLVIDHGFFIKHHEHSDAWGQAVFQMVSGTKNYCAMGFADGTNSGSHDNVLETITFTRHGNVGINKIFPTSRLHVQDNVGGNSFTGYRLTSSGTASSNNTSNIALYVYGEACVYGTIRVGSDRRIKENIVDVPDNLALEMVRKIPCRYYEYRNKINVDSGKTIGFIAQEVKEHFPMAVKTTQKEFLPTKMCELENISWNEIIDASSNFGIGFQLISDLEDVSGQKYKFFVSNDLISEAVEKEIIVDSLNRFIFLEKWGYVFCYGKEVDDFHTLDKQKLFALNFSATQELDKKVIALENENAELKAELAAIKQHLGI